MKLILALLLMLAPTLMTAQDDAKYLKGAVTEKDSKVVFSTKITIEGKTRQEVYSTLKAWCDKFGQTRKETIDNHTKLTYFNEDKGELVVNAEEYMTFSSTSFALDRTRIYYTLHLICHDGSYDISMIRIKYWYDENRNGGEHYLAEDLITDEYALNKSKTKLVKGLAKFRKGTIDLKDKVFEAASTAFGVKTLSAAKIVSNENKNDNENLTKDDSKQDEPVMVKAPVIPIAQPKIEKKNPVLLKSAEEIQPQTHIMPEETKRETVSFTLDKDNPAIDMLDKSATMTITVISPNGGVMMLEFTKLAKEDNDKMGTCTFTGEVRKANVK